MKQFVLTLIVVICSSGQVLAQNFLNHLQQQNQGVGQVTVKQSKEIDELVNGKATIIQDNKTKNTPTTKTTPSTMLDKKALENKNVAERKNTIEHKTAIEHKAATSEHKPNDTARKQEPDSVKKPEQHETENEKKEENEIPLIDMRKKVMRGSYKVTGYRVQAFAGGNSRADRQKAEQIGNAIKMRYPDQPVYVHFYSPRWICRVGNYRNLGEAQNMLAKVRAMGYKQACLVKGKITVQY